MSMIRVLSSSCHHTRQVTALIQALPGLCLVTQYSTKNKSSDVDDPNSDTTSKYDTTDGPTSFAESEQATWKARQISSSFASRRRSLGRHLSPSHRLGNLLPADYWKTQDPAIQDSVEFLQKPLAETTHDEKVQARTLLDQDSILEPFEYGKTILITVTKPSSLLPHKRFSRVISHETEETLSFYSFGSVKTADIIGKRPPLKLKSDNGNTLVITHPSLEEYMACLSKHPMTLTPKVSMRVLCNMPVCAGDTVFEAGSGSGHMSLLLSKLVGHCGLLESFDMVTKHSNLAAGHLKRAMRTFKDFPDNASFFIQDTRSATLNKMYDFVYLDLPSMVRIPAKVIRHLRPGKTLCFVSPSVSRIEEACAYVSRHQLPLVLEHVQEVPDISWIIAHKTLMPITASHNEFGTIFISKWRRIQMDSEMETAASDSNSNTDATTIPHLNRMLNQNTDTRSSTSSNSTVDSKPDSTLITDSTANLSLTKNPQEDANFTTNLKLNSNPLTSEFVNTRDRLALKIGDAVMVQSLFSPKKQRESRVLVVLGPGEQLLTHHGSLQHSHIIGRSSGLVMATSTGSRVVVYRPTLTEAIEAALKDKKLFSLKVCDYSFGFELCGLPVGGDVLLIGDLCPRVYTAACRTLGGSGDLFSQSPGKESVTFVEDWSTRIEHCGKLTPVYTTIQQQKGCDGALITDKMFKEDNMMRAIKSTKLHSYITVMSKRLDIISQYLSWLRSHPEQALTFSDLTQSHDRRWIIRKAQFEKPLGDEDLLTPYICRPTYKHQNIPVYYLRLRRTLPMI